GSPRRGRRPVARGVHGRWYQRRQTRCLRSGRRPRVRLPTLAHTLCKVRMRTSGVPGPAPHELRRERLLEALHRHRARPLILLVAAAGYGKSTLAATYARDSGAAVAWLSLQVADRDSRRLFARLADALDLAFEASGSVPE